jgi:hypothetical protein
MHGAEYAASCEREVQVELSQGHALFGIPLRAVGCSWVCDDVLFEIRDGSGRFAVVHIAWTRRAEPPPWPISTVYESIEAWEEDTN